MLTLLRYMSFNASVHFICLDPIKKQMKQRNNNNSTKNRCFRAMHYLGYNPITVFNTYVMGIEHFFNVYILAVLYTMGASKCKCS